MLQVLWTVGEAPGPDAKREESRWVNVRGNAIFGRSYAVMLSIMRKLQKVERKYRKKT